VFQFENAVRMWRGADHAHGDLGHPNTAWNIARACGSCCAAVMMEERMADPSSEDKLSSFLKATIDEFTPPELSLRPA
jgi:hypothetical protein